MGNPDENFMNEARLAELPVQAENIAYKPELMIVCRKCERTNPPNRLKCFYCAAELENVAEELIKVNLRRLELWEKGFNLIYLPQHSDVKTVAEIARLINLEKDVVQQIVNAEKPLPIARIETEKETQIVRANLQKLGMHTAQIRDEDLAAEKTPVRLRGLRFAGDSLLLFFFNTDEVAEVSREDLALIVTGAIFERKTESIEKRKKGENKVLDATETASDEVLLDIYARGDADGYRILMKGFDFSCLGAEKKMIASENLKNLADKLAEFAPNAKTVNDYVAIREILGNVWETERRRDSQGYKRTGFGKIDYSKTESSNNTQQFTKYSRLQRRIL